MSIGIEFSKRLGRGLFGGEGFIMQKLEGDGQVRIHAGGTTVQKELLPGEVLRVDTGCLAAMTEQVGLTTSSSWAASATRSSAARPVLRHAERPRPRLIQSLPFSRLADNIIAAAPKMGGKGKEKGHPGRTGTDAGRELSFQSSRRCLQSAVCLWSR